MEHLIGVDIGTQGTKTVLFTGDGRACASAFRPSSLHRPAGIVEEDPELQVGSVCDTIAECVAAAGIAPDSVSAIAIDGQMAGVIGVGTDGRHVTPYDSWLDTRCTPYIETMQNEAGDEIIRKTGGPPSVNHGPKILWWKHERPEVYARIASFVQPGGYAAMRLCGLAGDAAFIDSTYLHFSGFADNAGARWDSGLRRTFGVEESKLPRILRPHERVGGLNGEAAGRCSLTAGTPVIAGCGDTAASFLSCGATTEGVCVDVAGTASVFASTTAEFSADAAHRILAWGRSATPGLWHPYAYIGGGGMNVEWFRSRLAAPAQGTPPTLEELDRLAEALDPADNIPQFVPHLSGRVCPSQPGLRGAWVGLTGTHGTAHLYFALLEAVALEYSLFAEVLRELVPTMDLSGLRVTGGGAKSALWNRIKADALGIRVAEIAGSDGAPRGAAMLAGFGAGVISDLHEAAATWVVTGNTTEPDPARRKHYRKRAARYRTLLDVLSTFGST